MKIYLNFKELLRRGCKKNSEKKEFLYLLRFNLNFKYGPKKFWKFVVHPNNNLLLRGPVKLAKWLKKVKSSYRLEAHVRVRETKLQPFATVILKAK